MTDARVVLVVGVGAAAGGILRLLITQFVVARAGAGLAWSATLFINVTGSFLIGAVFAVSEARTGISPLWRYFLATGVLGGYTTFSTFSLDALNLATAGFVPTSVLYVAASVVLGIIAAFGGVAAGRAVAP